MGAIKLIIVKIPPIRPVPIMLANMSLWGWVYLIEKLLGRFGSIDENLFEISYPNVGNVFIVSIDADHTSKRNLLEPSTWLLNKEEKIVFNL